MMPTNSIRIYHWPGNIRELENVLERAVINASGPKLRLVDELKRANKDITLAYRVLADIEREYVVRVLEQINWKVSSQNSVSEILDFDRSTLRASMRMLKIQNN